MRRALLGLAALALSAQLALGQSSFNYIVPTAPNGTNNNQAASTAFVQSAIAAMATTCPAHQWVDVIAPTSITCAQPAFSDISGTIATGQVSGAYAGITGLGTIASGVWQGTAIDLTRGGLGGSQAAATAHQIPIYPGSGGAAVPYTPAIVDLNSYGVVYGSSGAAVANATAINQALLDASTLGGIVQARCGDIYFGANLDNQYAHVIFRGCGGMSDVHNVSGTNMWGTRLIPTGDFKFRVRTPYNGAGQAVWSGSGIQYVSLLGNSVSNRLLEVDTVRQPIIDVYVEDAIGTEAVLFTSGITGTNVGEAADIQGASISIQCREVEAGGIAADCVRFDGSANANFSFNNDVSIVCLIVNGNCINSVEADNNEIHVSCFDSGTGKCVINRGVTASKLGSYSNHYVRVSANGPIYNEGTSDSGVTGAVTNSIGMLDTANGSPLPTAGTGSYWTYCENTSLTCKGTAYGTSIPVTKTGTSGSQGVTDSSLIINASGAYTLTLLSAAAYPGRWLYIKSIAAQTITSASSNVVPIGTATAGTAILASGAGKYIALQSDGANWIAMAAN